MKGEGKKKKKGKAFRPEITFINTSADPVNLISQWSELRAKINQDAKLLLCAIKAI